MTNDAAPMTNKPLDRPPDGWRLDVHHSWNGKPETHEVAVYNDHEAMTADRQFLRNVWKGFGMVATTPLYVTACSACRAVGLVPELPPEGTFATCPSCTVSKAHQPDAADVKLSSIESRLARRGFAVVRNQPL